MNGVHVALHVVVVQRHVCSLVLIQTTVMQRDNAQATPRVNPGIAALSLAVSCRDTGMYNYILIQFLLDQTRFLKSCYYACPFILLANVACHLRVVLNTLKLLLFL